MPAEFFGAVEHSTVAADWKVRAPFLDLPHFTASPRFELEFF